MVITLTDKQFCMVSNCIEHITSCERNYNKEDEQLLKEIAEIFQAEYVSPT